MSKTELEALVAELRELIGSLRSTVETLNATVVARDARIAELESKLEESRRAGKRQAAPFSKGDPKPEPKRSGRKPGVAYGRRAVRPEPDRIDRELDAMLPEFCECGGEIEPLDTVAQFQIDLPKPVPVVTKFNVAVGRCQCCQRRVQGRHPEQTSDAVGPVGGVQIGPHAIATGLVMHYQHGLSFGRCAELLGQLGVKVHASTLVRAAERCAGGLEATCAALLAELNASPVVTADETGWRIGGMPAWLWAVTTATTTVYAVREGRKFTDATSLLDAAFSGVLVRDGYAPYRKYVEASHQSCTAHLLRRLVEMIADLPAEQRGLARAVKAVFDDALAARDLDPGRRGEVFADVTERIELLCAEAWIGDANRRLIKHLRNETDALFTYLIADDVDATNWRAEQAIRPAAVNRKVWGGNRTRRGATIWAQIATVLRTARLRQRDAIAMLVALARQPGSAQLNAFA